MATKKTPKSVKAPQVLKHAEHVAWRRVEAETVVLDLNTSVYYSLNETASYVWEKLGAGADLAAIAAGLSEEFDVALDKASKDAEEIVAEFRSEKLLSAA